jgi:hypothetical protein
VKKDWKPGDPVVYTGVVREVTDVERDLEPLLVKLDGDKTRSGRWLPIPVDTPAPATWDEGAVREVLLSLAEDAAVLMRPVVPEDVDEALTRLRSLAVPQRPSDNTQDLEDEIEHLRGKCKALRSVIGQIQHVYKTREKHHLCGNCTLCTWNTMCPLAVSSSEQKAQAERPSREELRRAISRLVYTLADIDKNDHDAEDQPYEAFFKAIGYPDPTPSPEEHRHCPWCGSNDIGPSGSDSDYQIKCSHCSAFGPWAGTLYNAWRLWDKPLDPQPGNGGAR